MNQLKQELEFNDEIKRRLLYTILQDEGISTQLRNCTVSLQNIRQLVKELERSDQDDRSWKFKLFELRGVFLRYANYEKEHIFQHARKLLLQKQAQKLRLQTYNTKMRQADTRSNKETSQQQYNKVISVTRLPY